MIDYFVATLTGDDYELENVIEVLAVVVEAVELVLMISVEVHDHLTVVDHKVEMVIALALEAGGGGGGGIGIDNDNFGGGPRPFRSSELNECFHCLGGGKAGLFRLFFSSPSSVSEESGDESSNRTRNRQNVFFYDQFYSSYVSFPFYPFSYPGFLFLLFLVGSVMENQKLNQK